jgi:Fur family transcriptional regulator, ferric uptake regulator
MHAIHTLRATLMAHHQSITKVRLAVFTALQDQEPLTMQQVVAHCPDIDRASVYRTIALFEELAIVQRLQVGWKYRIELSDAYHAHHHHATCLHCGNTIALPENDALEALLATLAAEQQFSLSNHQIELQGYCQNCRSFIP